MRPSFVHVPQPFIVSVITDDSPGAAISTIRNSECDGAHAFDLHLRHLKEEHRGKEALRGVIQATDKPILLINYRGETPEGTSPTDEERAQAQIIGIEAGASAADIVADLYDPSPLQMTRNATAIDRQRRLIDQIHALGGEVLMSNHTWEALTAEQTLEHAKAMEARGVDMVKIANSVRSEEDLLEAFRTTQLLKREMKVPFVHICMGQHGKIHRFVGPMMGSALIFCVQQYTAKGHKEQPLVRAAKRVFENLDYRIARSVTEGTV